MNCEALEHMSERTEGSEGESGFRSTHWSV